MDFLFLLSKVAPVFLIIAAGVCAYRLRWLSPEADSSLLRVVVNLLYPCLIFHTVLSKPVVMTSANVLAPPVIGFSTVTLGYLVSYLSAPLFGIGDARKRRTFAFTTGIYNYGYIALPIAESLCSGSAVTLLFIHNVGVEAALWIVGIMLLAGSSPRHAWRHILTPPVIAIAISLCFYFAGANRWLPSFLLSTFQLLGAAAIPLGLVLTGATFADQARARALSSGGQVALGGSLLRLGVLPLALLAIARWLPCSQALRNVIAIQAAMPSAVVPVILSKHYGGDPSVALRIVLMTSALGLLTIPLWLKFAVWLHILIPASSLPPA